MGKTKIMHEYKEKKLKEGDVTCVLIVPPGVETVQPTTFQTVDLVNFDANNADAVSDATAVKHDGKIGERAPPMEDVAVARSVAQDIFIKLDQIRHSMFYFYCSRRPCPISSFNPSCLTLGQS